ncbi:hypothetical protein FJ934_16560 [Mesorhizobium sp. B2-4-12]|uniref:hypothetical protein n=1 Tax=unclassified Mesorhizobium TaxID=325217 RepID=UPI00112E37B7|nr:MULTISPECIES: hypothetical protein [unclassified Mesorhizobium]TPK93894.1 hypothetical protein FJ934_16560 [Mesorhizobium sp. B2-4-12]TPL09592.1 hypothetical protein FJ938_07300 [Mesorhizobium sp. B2-4-14]
MARPKTALRDRIATRSTRKGDHLLWNGQMRGGRPHLCRVGNPARVLLGLTEHPDYQIRRNTSLCQEPNCIEPEHFRVIRERRYKFDDAPNSPWRDPRDRSASQFTDQELEEIEMEAEAGTSEDQLKEYYRPEMVAEILARATARST